MLRTNLAYLLLTLAISSQSLVAQELPTQEEPIAEVCDAFLAAHLTGDVDCASQLLAPESRWLSADGKEAKSALSIIEARHQQLNKKPNASFELLELAHRDVQQLESVAIVTELFHTANVPRRRTLTLSKSGKNWHIVHIHSSHYDHWENAIRAFETGDQEAMPTSGGIVFVGSSSIRKWDSLADDFQGLNPIQRGFGGSQMIDSLLYARRIVTAYKPKTIVVYEGDNDIGSGKSPQRVAEDFQQFVHIVREDLPQVNIGFIAIKPSLKRWNLWPKMQQANQLIQEIAAEDERIEFLDIGTPMLGEDGMPKPELFVKDGLHLSPAGYEAWTTVVHRWLDNL